MTAVEWELRVQTKSISKNFFAWKLKFYGNFRIFWIQTPVVYPGYGPGLDLSLEFRFQHILSNFSIKELQIPFHKVPLSNSTSNKTSFINDQLLKEEHFLRMNWINNFEILCSYLRNVSCAFCGKFSKWESFFLGIRVTSLMKNLESMSRYFLGFFKISSLNRQVNPCQDKSHL